MKQKFYFLIFLAFIAGTSKAQTINKIKLDSLTEIVALQQKFKDEGTKSMMWQQSSFDIEHLKGKDKKTTGIERFFYFPDSWYAYYYNETLVFAYHEYMENSRMGSCGDIRIYDYYFIEDKKFLNVYHFEEPFDCYHRQPLSTVEQLLNTLK